MAYDSATGKAILFAGKGRDYYNDTWAYAGAANAWTDLRPAGSLPPARFGHAMDFSAADTKVVIFGGVLQSSGKPANDTWAYDSAANSWSDRTPSAGPPARTYPAMVTDAASGKMILFGGWTGSAAFDDTWAYDPIANTWTELKPTGSPPARWGASMVYDPSAGKVILFGGLSGSYDGSSRFNDTWAYDPTANTWTELKPTGHLPPSRGYGGMVDDSAMGKVILFGGFAGGNVLLDDTWAYDPRANTWIDLNPAEPLPSARDFHAMVYDPTSDKVVLFGGLTGSTGNVNGTLLGDTWGYGGTR